MISIIIPTLSEQRLIKQALHQFTEAIRNRHDIEIIVSDGGSSDETVHIARSLADKVVIYDGQVRQTIAGGRNAGAEKASGDLLFFMNADTLIDEPDSFLSIVEEVMKNPRILALTCYVRVYPEEEKMSDKLFHGTCNLFFDIVNSIGIGMGRGECHIIRRSVFEAERGYNDVLVAGEDFDLYSRIRRRGKIKFLRNRYVFESPRRYRRFGYHRVAFDWFRNAVSVKLFKRSVIDEWTPIR
jgi:glycosyltransferase involved in cell wall biosynthesis